MSGKVGRPRNPTLVKNLKEQLANEVVNLIRTKGYTQKEAARVFRTYQPRVSNLVQGHLEDFSIDSLVDILEFSGIKVHISTTKPRTRALPKASGPLSKRYPLNKTAKFVDPEPTRYIPLPEQPEKVEGLVATSEVLEEVAA